jgi:FAD binding domain
VIKLCEMWANIYPIFNLVIKTSQSRGSSAPATIPSASRSKTTRRTRAGRRRDGSYCGRPACPRGGGQATCPQIPGTDLKVLGFTTSVPRSRAAVPCLPAAGVFLAGDSASIINPLTGGLGGKTPRSPGRPQPGLEAVAAVLHGPAGPALFDTYHNERHPIGLLTICSSRPLPGSAPPWVKAPRCPTHRL